MRQWMVLFKKEWLEMLSNYKLFYIPLVFILLGILQPVSSYYMPQLIDKAGNLPEGTIIEIPVPTSGEVLAQTLGQFSQLGALIVVLSFMGIIAAERSSGVASIILVKPVSYISYITSKWTSASILTAFSYLLGMLAAYYYTILLIGDIAFATFLKGTFVYGLWVIILVSLTVLFSSFLKSNGMVAFATLGLTILLSIVSSLIPKWMRWSPSRLSEQANALFINGTPNEDFYLVLGSSIILIAISIWASIKLFQKKELID